MQRADICLAFFIRRLMWFSFSSSVFLKMSTCLWFSKSSLWRWWLFSSKVSQITWTQDQVSTCYLRFRYDSAMFWRRGELTLVSSKLSNGLCWSTKHRNCLTGSLRSKYMQHVKSNQGGTFFSFYHDTHLFMIRLCDDNLCRNDCSPTCLSSRNSLS